ncbi:nibrin isoform 2-T3 [Porphyrio hochstetteri]
MWKLVPAAGKGEPYRLLSGTEYVVGRKNCAILIQDDQSISRSHAVLTVSHPETTPSQSLSVPVLTVKDTSKYGTFVNGSKLNGSSVSLQSGDRINFGVFESKFSFYPPVDEPCIGTEKLDFSEHHERRKIFSGKTFVFLTAKQHKKLGPAVTLGGGEAKLLMEGRKDTSLLVSPEVCVVDVGLTNSQIPASDSMRNWTESILAVLQSKDLRAIPEAEIGLAVIFMSTEEYCNPQKQPGNKAVTKSTPASALAGRAISQSLAVDETIVPDDSTVYVADTEIEELTCMETENTQMDRSGKTAFQDIIAVKKNPSTSGNVNEATLVSRVNRTPGFSQKSHPGSPSKISEAGKRSEFASRHQSNSITNYFQVARKRDRAEEGETSVPKLTKLEERSSPVSNCTEPTASSVWTSEAGQHRKKNNILDTNPNCALEHTSIKPVRGNGNLASDKTDTKITSGEQHAAKKRKELDDLSEDTEALEIVFGKRDLDWEDEMADHDQEAQGNTRKKRCLEDKRSLIQEVNIKQKEDYKTLKEDKLESGATSETESEIKQESAVLNHNKPEDDSSNLPSRLLLTEFRSLVVSHPRLNSQLTGNTSYGEKKNFKVFRKVAYPGAGQLPYIIGGSDLIAHHAKKNSELEEWLRQEMEEQNRHAREESLADDLFRYDPNVKRRR